MNEQTAEFDHMPPVGTPRGPLRWACAVCRNLLLGQEHTTAPEDGHPPIRILTRDVVLPPKEAASDD